MIIQTMKIIRQPSTDFLHGYKSMSSLAMLGCLSERRIDRSWYNQAMIIARSHLINCINSGYQIRQPDNPLVLNQPILLIFIKLYKGLIKSFWNLCVSIGIMINALLECLLQKCRRLKIHISNPKG